MKKVIKKTKKSLSNKLHDIRGNLAVAGLYSELLGKEKLTKAQKVILRRIKLANKKAASLILKISQ